MSQIALCLVDHETEWWGEPHASEVDVVVAALSAEPETLGELEAALQRFAAPGETISLRQWHGNQRNLEHGYDAGLCVIHLPARLIACESTYSYPSRDGGIVCGERENGKEIVAGYHLPDDWTITSDVHNWHGHARSLMEKRLAEPLLDARPVLYEAVCEFLVDECLAVRNFAGTEWSPPDGWRLTELAHRYTGGCHKIDGEPKPCDVVAEIHARWLMTPREDLRGRSPREVLMQRKSFLDWDLQDRQFQWSAQGHCPPPLHPETIAYRYGGFGSHEFLVYYDLLRELLWTCWEDVVAQWSEEPTADDPYAGRWLVDVERSRSIDRKREVARLRGHRDVWLTTPNHEDFCGRTPQEVIELERRRIPTAGDPHDHIVDDDCPLCQMMAELPGPMFWHLDGCNNDDDFPFSCIHDTYEKWEQEQQRHEEWSREWKQQEAERKRLREAGQLPADDSLFGDESGVWSRSYVQPPDASTPPAIRLAGIGAHLTELIDDLRSQSDSRGSVETLNRCFGNVREVLADESPSLLGPAVGRMCDELATAAQARPDVSARCEHLARQLRELEQASEDAAERRDDYPF